MSKHTRERPKSTQGQFGWLVAMLAGAVFLGAMAWLAWRNGGQPAGTASTGTPSLKADKETVDLGDVRLGQTVSVSFELTNTGDAPLRFKEAPFVEVVAGC